MIQQMVEMEHKEAAVRLLAELAHSAFSVACSAVVQLVTKVHT